MPLVPPPRFEGASFETYRPQNDAQAGALAEAERFAERVRQRYTGWRRLARRLRREDGLRGGLYLVGPVGTGKTHLLTSIHHALHPEIPCAFLHSSALFRATEHPEAYAERLARRVRVLLIDEVELDDPANEIRLILVLKTLNRLGVTVAATSNAEPEKFLSAEFGRDRLERFISEEFRRTYHVVFVPGEDFRRRLARPGRAWIGPLDAADAAMREAFERDPHQRRWISHEELMRLATATERQALTDDLASTEHLYLSGLEAATSDDALRLLRIVDDLYTHPRAPVLFFSARRPPRRWFPPERAETAIERAVAEKFARTASRLEALCTLEPVGAAVEAGPGA